MQEQLASFPRPAPWDYPLRSRKHQLSALLAPGATFSSENSKAISAAAHSLQLPSATISGSARHKL